MAILLEARYYTTGFAFRFWRFQLRWNNQDNYCGLSLEFLQPSYFAAGGQTWKEFVATRKQRRLEEAEYRRIAMEAKETINQ